MSTSLQCPPCVEPDSALHTLSGCIHSTMSIMVTERHNIAGKILFKGISKGPWGGPCPNGLMQRKSFCFTEPADP
eukprot:1155250-Pelagomonas_calceolata.AAC.3